MASNPYRDVTLKILEELKTALATGAKPVWVQPWSRTNLAMPRNAASGRQYSGVNIILIWLATRAAGWKAPYFLTFKQALELGGHVRKGEHGTKIYFVKDLAFAENGQDEPQVDERAVRHIRMLKTFTVFNVQQCENLPAHIVVPPGPAIRHSDSRDPLIDNFVAAAGAKVMVDGDRACFDPVLDLIRMPPFASFSSAATFYATEFHELGHWTGDGRRLARCELLEGRFGDRQYAAEEWIAEFVSAFLCCEFAVDGDLRHVEYMAGWIDLIEHDDRAFFTIVSKAQAAVDFLREQILKEPTRIRTAPFTDVSERIKEAV